MSPNLSTVHGFVAGVRGLLQDKVRPYRYPDKAIIASLNLALLEGRRLRPDLFLHRYGIDVPQYEEMNGDHVPVEPQFRLAFEFGIAGLVLLRDEEDVQDSRANSFTAMFHDMLVGVRPGPIQGGTPIPRKVGGGDGTQER